MSDKPSNSHDDDNNSNTDSNKDDGFDIPPEEETATPQRLASPLQDITPTHHELNLNPDINYWIRKKQEEIERARAESLQEEAELIPPASNAAGNETAHQHNLLYTTPQPENAVLFGTGTEFE